MFQLDILLGKKAGTRWVTRHFPFRVGRASDMDLQLDDDGIWARHAEISLNPESGAVLCPQPDALTAVNGHRVTGDVFLRNGDLLELGSLQLRFGLSPSRPASLRWREGLTWFGLGLLCAAQIGLIYWLLLQ